MRFHWPTPERPKDAPEARLGLWITVALLLYVLLASLAAHGGGLRRGGGGGFSSVVVKPNASVSTPFWHYGNGNCGSAPCISADTFDTAWADDDKIYMTANDTGNFNNAASSNMSISTISDYSPAMVGTLVNPLTVEFGGQGQNDPGDHANWKTQGLMSVNGVLYLMALRLTDGSGTPPFTPLSATLIKSSDHGAHWTPIPPGTAQPIPSPMFPQAFGAPMFVKYPNKDYVGQTADQSDQYVYALSGDFTHGLGAMPTTNFLGRCLVSNATGHGIVNQNAADWTFWQGDAAGLNWGPLGTAAVVMNASALASGMILYDPEPLYVPAYQGYVAWTQNSSFSTYYMLFAPHQWGPWEVRTTINNINNDGIVYNRMWAVQKSLAQGTGKNYTMLMTSDYRIASQYTIWGSTVTLTP